MTGDLYLGRLLRPTFFFRGNNFFEEMKSGHLVMVILGQNHFPKPLFTLLRICPVFLEFVIESFPVYSKQLRSFALIASSSFDGRFYTL